MINFHQWNSWFNKWKFMNSYSCHNCMWHLHHILSGKCEERTTNITKPSKFYRSDCWGNETLGPINESSWILIHVLIVCDTCTTFFQENVKKELPISLNRWSFIYQIAEGNTVLTWKGLKMTWVFKHLTTFCKAGNCSWVLALERFLSC